MAISNKDKAIFDWWRHPYLLDLLNTTDTVMLYREASQNGDCDIFILSTYATNSQLLKELYGRSQTKTYPQD